MKNRILALCLAIALLISVMPAMTLAGFAVTADTSIEAVFTSEAMTVDGNANELSWSRVAWGSATLDSGVAIRMAVLLIPGKAYIAVRGEGVTSVSAALDGKAATASATEKDTTELSVPGVAVSASGEVLDLDLVVNGEVVTADVVVAQKEVNLADNGTTVSLPYKTDGYGYVNPGGNRDSHNTYAQVYMTTSTTRGINLKDHLADGTAVTGGMSLDHSKEAEWTLGMRWQAALPDTDGQNLFSVTSSNQLSLKNGIAITFCDANDLTGGSVVAVAYMDDGYMYLQILLPGSTESNVLTSGPIKLWQHVNGIVYSMKFIWHVNGDVSVCWGEGATPASYTTAAVVANATWDYDSTATAGALTHLRSLHNKDGDFVQWMWSTTQTGINTQGYLWGPHIFKHTDPTVALAELPAPPSFDAIYTTEDMVADNTLSEYSWLRADFTAFGSGDLASEVAAVVNRGTAYIAVKTDSANTVTVTLDGKPQTAAPSAQGFAEFAFSCADLMQYGARLPFSVSVSNGDNTAALELDTLNLLNKGLNIAEDLYASGYKGAGTNMVNPGIQTSDNYGGLYFNSSRTIASWTKSNLDLQGVGTSDFSLDHSKDILLDTTIGWNIPMPENDGTTLVNLSGENSYFVANNSMLVKVYDDNATTGGFFYASAYFHDGAYYMKLIMPTSRHGAIVYSDEIKLMDYAEDQRFTLRFHWAADGTVTVAVAAINGEVTANCGVRAVVSNATWTASGSAYTYKNPQTMYKTRGDHYEWVGVFNADDLSTVISNAEAAGIANYSSLWWYIFNDIEVVNNFELKDAAAPNGAVDTYSVTLQEDVGLNFTVNTTMNAGSIIIKMGDVVLNETALAGGTTSYNISVELAAAQMTDVITVYILDANGMGSVKTYTVRGYADTILAGNYSDATKNLVRAMLNYGAAAQIYFNYNVENLANAGIDVSDFVADPAAATPMAREDNSDAIDYHGAALLFQNKIAIRYYFKNLTGDISEYSFHLNNANGEELEVQKNQTGYYVDVQHIYPQQLDEQYTVCVVDASGNTLTVSYSATNYMANIYRKSTQANSKALAKAMYNYYLAAEAYVNP